MSKLSKNDLKGPDAFVSTVDKAWHIIEHHRKIWIFVISIIFVAGLSYTLFNLVQSRREASAQSEYYVAKKSLTEAEKSFQPKVPEPPQSKDAKAAKSKDEKNVETSKVKSGDINADYGGAVTALEGVIQKHPGSKAAAMAALDLSPLFFEYKQNDRALNILTIASKAVSKSDLLFGFVYLQLGAAQQANGKCEDAITSWKKVSDSKNHTFLHSEALLNEGLCLESLGQKDKAVDVYRKVSQDFGDTDAGKSAKNYLRQITNEKS